LGVLIGMSGFAIAYGDAPAYLGDDPQTCASCHVMQDHYDRWDRGSHANVATCNDCHLPHGDLVSKYLVKADAGALHVSSFTFGTPGGEGFFDYPQNIVIRDSSLRVVDGSCLYCHGDVVEQMRSTAGTDGDVSCARCHSGVGHR